GVFQDRGPRALCFGESKTHAPIVEHRSVARHRMRSADDAILHAILQRITGQVDAAMKLMRLYAGKSQQRGRRTAAQTLQVLKICMDVFVDDGGFDFTISNAVRRHASKVGNGSIRHEALSKTFHISVRAILTWFYNDNAQSVWHRLFGVN